MQPRANKAFSLEELAARLSDCRQRGQKVALCHGVFDLLHVGHLRHFRQARDLADLLVVTVTPDRFVNKGPGRPVFGEDLRLESLSELECVDYVAVNEWPTAIETIRLLKPDFYVKGAEYRDAAKDITGKITEEQAAIDSVGGKLMFTDGLVFSSSSLLNAHLSPLSKELAAFLATFRKQFSYDDVAEWLERVSNSRVLVVGETILDEYHHCETIGKSGKEPILAARFVKAERHAGGVLAIANHLASFCKSVTLVTQLGAQNSHEDFVRANLHPAIDARLLKVDSIPTIIKRRYVETYPFQKLFEIYVMNDEQDVSAQQALAAEIGSLIGAADLVVAADYGHGMLEGAVVERLSTEAPFLALNTQKNAGNHGFNTASKYLRADFVSVSEGELRLDARRKSAPIDGLLHALADRMRCQKVMVTRGQSGALCYSADGEIVSVPALTLTVKDRVGAGDAVFAVTSLLAQAGAPLAILALVGNAAGAQAVETIGNRHAIDRSTMLKHIQHLLK